MYSEFCAAPDGLQPMNVCDWLDGLHETTADDAVTNRKWPEAQAARALVHRLIEADKEYDAAIEALKDLNRRIAEKGWIEVEFDALRKAGDRVCRAHNFRAVALRTLAGGA